MAAVWYNIRERIEGEMRYNASVKKELISKMVLPERFELSILSYDPPQFHIIDSITEKIYKSHNHVNDNYVFYTIESLQKIVLEDLKWERRKSRIEKLLSTK